MNKIQLKKSINDMLNSWIEHYKKYNDIDTIKTLKHIKHMINIDFDIFNLKK